MEWNFLFDSHLKIKLEGKKREEVKKGQKEHSGVYFSYSEAID